MFDGKAFGAEIVGIVKAHVARSLEPLLARLEALESALANLPVPKDGKDGKSVSSDDIATLVAPLVEKAVAALPKAMDGKDGSSVDVETVKAMVSDLVADAVAQIPAPVDGKDGEDGKSISAEDVGQMIASMVEIEVAGIPKPKDGKDVDPETVKALIEAEVAKMPAPKDGKDVDFDQVKALVDQAVAALVIKEMVNDAVAALPAAPAGKDADPNVTAALVAETVERAVASLPRPQDGKSVTLDELRPIVEESVAKAVGRIPAAKDGVGTAGALIDRAGDLILTMTDGKTVNLGCVVGRDADMDALRKGLAEAIDAMPRPTDGVDGFGFDDMDVQHDGERGFTLRFTKGERIKEFPFTVPVVLDRGVYRQGSEYQKGDGVTWNGSFWVAQENTVEKPEGGKGWRLAVKRGRDGKDGVVKTVAQKPVVKVG